MNIALILSGGTGTRLGASIPKQYLEVNNRMIITYCIEMFNNHPDIDGIWIVADRKWRLSILDNLSSCSIPLDNILGFSEPGSNRQLSILNGLLDIRSFIQDKSDDLYIYDENIVIIHDAARPNLSSDFVSNCLDAIEGHDGVMPVLPMKDTVYVSKNGTTISGLLDRSTVYAGQAPELYRLDKYIDANNALLPDKILKINGSTEPAVLAGLDVAIIPGDENNYKITTSNDLEKFKQARGCP